MPHFSHIGSATRGTRAWQSGHQRNPVLPQPPHTGGKIKSSPLQVHRVNRYDQGMLLTNALYLAYTPDPINCNMAGVRMMIRMDGKINKAIGMIILMGALWACSSANW